MGISRHEVEQWWKLAEGRDGEPGLAGSPRSTFGGKLVFSLASIQIRLGICKHIHGSLPFSTSLCTTHLRLGTSPYGLSSYKQLPAAGERSS